MLRYQAIHGHNPVYNPDLRRVLAPRLAAHRAGAVQGGRFLLADYTPAHARATANSQQAGLGVAVSDAALRSADDFLSVSGLTYCIGLMVLRRQGGRFVHGVTAHFNGNYEDAQAWTRIERGIGGAGGTLHAVVISTRDTTPYWQENGIVPCYRGALRRLGVSDAHLCFYQSSHSGVAFLVRGDGLMGEPNDAGDFPY